MRNDALALLVLLLSAPTMARAAASSAGAWFPPSACNPQQPAVVAPLGGYAILSVHDRYDAPPHDARLHHGEDGRWLVAEDEWTQWTPRPPPEVVAVADGNREVPLPGGGSFAFRIDACTAELWVDADPERLQQMPLVTRPQAPAMTRSGVGGYLNLDAEYGGLAGSGYYSSLFDLGAFMPGGTGRSGFLAGRGGSRRLDTDWLHDEPEQALRLRLGDSVSHAAEWESAVRFGGVQWGTDFSLQPDRITFPLPSINGSAALPSVAQLYLNGQPLSQQPLQPGQFRFDSVPVITGAGDLSVVVRDAAGREHTVVQPFYVSPRLLAAGLDNFTVEGGFLRQDYAQADDRYTMPYAGTVWQHGLSAVLTVTGRAAAGDRRQQTGAEADWVLGDWGLFSASAAASHTEAGWGGIGTLAFERVADPFSLSLRRRFATSAYGDLGRDPGSLHFSDAARLSYNARRAGVASLVYLSEQPWSGAGTRLAGLAYSVQLRSGAELFASWLHPVGGQGSDSIVAGLSIYFGGGTSAGAQWSRDGGSSGPREYVQHAPMGPLGWSWYASAEERTGGVRQAQASWASARGTLGAGWAGFDGHGAPSASAQTGLAWFDRDLYWTRPIQNSFAVVDAGGLPGVRVYRENQLVGQTDASGHLLVPDLLPYQANRLDIDDRDLPISLGLQSGSAVLAPQANAGVPLRFTVDTQAPVRFHLRNTAGEPVPAGAALLLDGQPLPLPLGYDGLVYAAIGDGRHTVEARWGTRYCKAVVVVGGTEAKVRPCR